MKTLPFDVRSVRIWMAENDVRSKQALAELVGMNKKHISAALKHGQAGEYTVLKLEELIGRSIRVERQP